MGSRLNPYISYNGNARQAMEFYQEVFDGKLQIGTVADFGSPDAPDADKVMHAQLDTSEGYTLLAWDVPAGVPYHPGNNVAVYLGGDNSELRSYFEKLSAGGTVTMPLDKQVWGDEAGARRCAPPVGVRSRPTARCSPRASHPRTSGDPAPVRQSC